MSFGKTRSSDQNMTGGDTSDTVVHVSRGFFLIFRCKQYQTFHNSLQELGSTTKGRLNGVFSDSIPYFHKYSIFIIFYFLISNFHFHTVHFIELTLVLFVAEYFMIFSAFQIDFHFIQFIQKLK